MLRCTLLGTAAAVPTAARDNTALLFVGSRSSLLVDCPGGAYAKLLRAGLAPVDLTHLLLTHTHTDHTHGLPGMLQSVWLAGRQAALPVLGLPEVQALVDRVLDTFEPFGKRSPFALPRQVLPGTADDSPVLETPDFRVWTAPTDHSVPGVAVRVESRASGAAVVYSSDTRPCARVERLAAGAHLLVHEATFSAAAAAEAAQHAHSTSAEAADIAQRAGARALWLVHYSPQNWDDLAARRVEAITRFQGDVAVPDDQTSYEF